MRTRLHYLPRLAIACAYLLPLDACGGKTGSSDTGSATSAGGALGAGAGHASGGLVSGATAVGGTTNTLTATAIATGRSDACAVLNDGTMRCWGVTVLDNGNTTNSGSVLVQVPGITNAIAVVDREYHACALLADRTVQCWGSDVKDGLEYYDADAGIYINVPTFQSSVPVVVSGITDAIALAAGYSNTCAVLGDGTVQCWGAIYWGTGPAPDYSFTPVVVSGITNAVAVAAGGGHICVLLGDSTVQCWGQNTNGELGNGTTTDSDAPVRVVGITQAVALAAGQDHTCAVLKDGTAQCWGSNYTGQLGNGSPTGWVGSGPAYSNIPVVVSGVTNAISSSGGEHHNCAVLKDGTVRCWGLNVDGDLGNGTTADSNVPVTVSGITNANTVAAGTEFTCALLSRGEVQCWGDDSAGQLGYSDPPTTICSSGSGLPCGLMPGMVSGF